MVKGVAEMRIATTVVFALVILTMVGATVASAQTPFIAVYFDQHPNFSLQKDCPGPGADELYVMLVNANAFVSGAEYMISYPGSMTYLADTNTPPVTVGNSPTGIALGFNLPQNGYFALLLHTVSIFWNCSDCTATNDPIEVLPSPFNPSGNIQFTDWPNYGLFDAIGLTSQVCATVATEETTWGQVKALYSE
jgi:hypothetical protein